MLLLLLDPAAHSAAGLFTEDHEGREALAWAIDRVVLSERTLLVQTGQVQELLKLKERLVLNWQSIRSN